MGHTNINIEDKKKWVLEYFPALRVHLNRNGGVLSGGLPYACNSKMPDGGAGDDPVR